MVNDNKNEINDCIAYSQYQDKICICALIRIYFNDQLSETYNLCTRVFSWSTLCYDGLPYPELIMEVDDDDDEIKVMSHRVK